jgi:uncharacterized lipoprotein YddW (UPF0748 family)
VVVQSAGLNASLLKAYGLAQSPRWPELRGVWDHTGTGLYPGDWDRTCRVLSENGITDIFANVMWPCVAHYPSGRLSRSESFGVHGDQLRQCLDAARAYKMNVHVWKVCWKLSHASTRLKEGFRKQGRLQVTDRGVPLDWLCPTHPANREMELSSIRDVVVRYRPAGMHLDYIRYPSSHACFCEGCRERFVDATGTVISRWPHSVKSGPGALRYGQWRKEMITSFVRECRSVVREASSSTKLSAAVYGKYPSCVKSVGQDWRQWLSEDLVDFLCPMNYTEDMRTFRSYVDSQLALAGGVGNKIVPGIGVSATESDLTAVQTIDQVRIARRAGASGFVLFELNRDLEQRVLPLLRRGITAE